MLNSITGPQPCRLDRGPRLHSAGRTTPGQRGVHGCGSARRDLCGARIGRYNAWSFSRQTLANFPDEAVVMKVWDWQDLVLDNGILRESMSDGSRLVLWVPGARDGTFQYWERVGIAARAEVTVAEGLCATAATSIPVRQRLGGLFGKLLGRLREAKGSRDFVLPGGGSAEQCGERAADLMLVWAEDPNAVLEADRIQARWPEGGRHQRLGPNLYLVGGLQTQATSPAAAAAPPVPSPEVSPRKNAEDILAAARQAGDRPNEASALTDL